MCFNLHQNAISALKRMRYYVNDQDEAYWLDLLRVYKEGQRYMLSGFSHPKLIVYENNEDSTKPVLSTWGLVPSWAKTAESIWNNTLNARGETIFEKSSFRKSANEKRCLIPVDGFYDFHDFKGKKYPFYITKKDNMPIYFAGLWNDWANPESGEIINTCSIVTTQANQLMAKIHNKPKFSNDPRMPVMLPKNIAEEWLKPLTKQELQELATYLSPDSELDAWTVRPLSGKNAPGNVPEANKEFEYPDLEWGDKSQLSLF